MYLAASARRSVRPWYSAARSVAAVATLACCHLASDAQAAEAETAEPSQPESDALTSNVHVNVAGALLFGLTPSVELGSQHWSALARLRFLSTGLLAHSLIPEDEDHSLKFSWGGGLGARYYQAEDEVLTGLHAGVVVEYLKVRLENSRLQAGTLTGTLVPQFEVGYRWRLDRLLVGFGAGIGYSIIVSKGVEDLSRGQSPYAVENLAENDVFASAAVDVGYFF